MYLNSIAVEIVCFFLEFSIFMLCNTNRWKLIHPAIHHFIHIASQHLFGFGCILTILKHLMLRFIGVKNRLFACYIAINTQHFSNRLLFCVLSIIVELYVWILNSFFFNILLMYYYQLHIKSTAEHIVHEGYLRKLQNTFRFCETHFPFMSKNFESP